jgi:signal transduction histidine kinase
VNLLALFHIGFHVFPPSQYFPYATGEHILGGSKLTSILYVDRSGKIRSRSSGPMANMKMPLVDLFKLADAGKVSEILANSRGLASPLQIMLTSRSGDAIVLVVAGWRRSIRRHLVLIADITECDRSPSSDVDVQIPLYPFPSLAEPYQPRCEDQPTRQSQVNIYLRNFVSDLSSYLCDISATQPNITDLSQILGHQRARCGSPHCQEAENACSDRLISDVRIIKRFAGRYRQQAYGVAEKSDTLDGRREIARRLHEGVVQDLVTLRWGVEMGVDPAQVAAKALQNVRSIVSDLLIPPWRNDLARRIEEQLTVVRDSGISATYVVEVKSSVSRDQSAVILTVVEENLANVLRHTNARNLSIYVNTVNDDMLSVTVHDDGSPQHPQRHGSGYGHRLCHELAIENGGSFTFEEFPDGHLVRFTMSLEILSKYT